MTATVHVPVMTDAVIAQLRAEEGGLFVDCTFGGGGHSAAILAAHPENQVLAFDCDSRAVERGRARFAGDSRIMIDHAAFSELEGRLSGMQCRGMLADLGLSTDQLNERRGFAFKDDKLDMRMDEAAGPTAWEIVNQRSERQLFILLKRGGVGPEAARIAKAIVRARPINSAAALAQTAGQAAKQAGVKKNVHPATVVFQAVRMAVNRELEELECLLSAAPAVVCPGGRLAVISFHSLEDQVVAKRMRAWEAGDTRPASWPGVRESFSAGTVVTRKALKPSQDECRANPSARSARLRVFQFSQGGE
jgi:16S rRNA (cytosine1402-N4)-methyltransferase